MKKYFIQNTTIRGQHGAVTMFFVLMLMFLMAVMALAVGKLAMVEQETVGADYRAKEATEATTTGLEYALAWLDNNNKCTNCGLNPGVSYDFEPDGLGSVTTYADSGETGYEYNPTVRLTAAANAPTFLHVEASLEAPLDATGGGAETGDSITGKESVWTTQWNKYLSPAGESAPPFVLDGCMSGLHGQPDVYPQYNGTAVLTLTTDDPFASAPQCIELKGNGSAGMNVSVCQAAGACGVNESGGVTGTSEAASDPDAYLNGINIPDDLANPGLKAWNFLFKIPLSDAILAAQVSSQVNLNGFVPTDDDYTPFVLYTNTSNRHGTYGSIERPVVLIMMGDGCTKFNGGATVFGVIYFHLPKTGVGVCNGFGGANVIGTVVAEGDMVALNSNTDFIDSASLRGVGTGGSLFVDQGARIPGTWRDW